MKRALQLAHGLSEMGGIHKRVVMLAFAFYAKGNGGGCVSDTRLRNATEMGSNALTRIIRELAEEGWIKRDGNGFTLAIAKMEANQRIFMSRKEYLAHIQSWPNGQQHKPGASAPLTAPRKEIYVDDKQ